MKLISENLLIKIVYCYHCYRIPAHSTIALQCIKLKSSDVWIRLLPPSLGPFFPSSVWARQEPKRRTNRWAVHRAITRFSWEVKNILTNHPFPFFHPTVPYLSNYFSALYTSLRCIHPVAFPFHFLSSILDPVFIFVFFLFSSYLLLVISETKNLASFLISFHAIQSFFRLFFFLFHSIFYFHSFTFSYIYILNN